MGHHRHHRWRRPRRSCYYGSQPNAALRQFELQMWRPSTRTGPVSAKHSKRTYNLFSYGCLVSLSRWWAVPDDAETFVILCFYMLALIG